MHETAHESYTWQEEHETSQDDELFELIESNEKKDRLRAHDMLAAIEKKVIAMYNVRSNDPNVEQLLTKCKFLLHSRKITNAFLKSRVSDIIASSPFDPHPESISGMPGGGTEAIKYISAHLEPVSRNRVAYNQTQNYPTVNTIIPISQTLVAKYTQGVYHSSYKRDQAKEVEVAKVAQELATKKDPVIHEQLQLLIDSIQPHFPDDEITRELFAKLGVSQQDNNHQLRLLPDVKKIVRDHPDSFIDIDSLQTGSQPLHFILQQELVVHNEKVISQHLLISPAVEVSDVEAEVQLFPYQSDKSSEFSEYTYIAGPSGRALIEKTFDLDFSTLPNFAQPKFLSYIETLTEEELYTLGAHFKKLHDTEKQNAIVAFFSAETDDERKVITDLVTQIAEKQDKTTSQILDNVATLSSHAASIEELLITYLKNPNQEQRISAQSTSQQINRRATKLLTSAQKIDVTKVGSFLEQFNNSLELQIAILESAGKDLSFEDLTFTQFEVLNPSVLDPDEKQQLIDFILHNRTLEDEEKKALVKEVRNALDSKDTTQTFALLWDTEQDPKQIIACERTQQLPSGNLYVGSLTVRPQARKSVFSEKFMQRARAEMIKNKTTVIWVDSRKLDLVKSFQKLGYSEIPSTGEVPQPSEHHIFMQKQGEHDSRQTQATSA